MRKTLTKAELARQLALPIGGRQSWLTIKMAVFLIEQLFDLIVCYFQNEGEQVTIRGFGTFKVRGRARHRVRAPSGVLVDVPARKTVVFKPSAEVVRRLNY